MYRLADLEYDFRIHQPIQQNISASITELDNNYRQRAAHSTVFLLRSRICAGALQTYRSLNKCFPSRLRH
jgi:hypothetical protein